VRVVRSARRVLIVGLAAALLPILVFTALDRAFPLDLSRLGDVSTVVSDREGRPLKIFLNGAGAWRMPAAVADVTPEYLDLLIAYEDKRFRSHFGIDLFAIPRATLQNLRAGRVVSGASTLTMQTARLLEPRSRSLTAKIAEAFRALQLERHFSKDDILGMYLTLAPMGGNLEGVRAGAAAWFGTDPIRLTTPGAALLAALPRSPTRARPDRAPERSRRARDAVIDRAVKRGVLDPERGREAREEPVPDRRLPMPDHARHLAERVARIPGSETERRTTIDGAFQTAVEELARRRMGDMDERAGLSILVLDRETRAALAYVGAPDPDSDLRLGSIDMVSARRSPGSAMKPFVYAMGFDDGFIHPETLVSDVSTRFGDYAPQNFDRDFAGDLTITEALRRSLNVPAVLVLDRVGPRRFVEALRRVGVRYELPPGAAPGLPIALGGGAINLWDLTSLYLGLGREGRVSMPRILADRPAGAEVPFCSPESARRVLRVLEGVPPPPGMVQATEARLSTPIAYKTGTSYGFRDAWAVGVSARRVVGVWVGRPDGTPSPDRLGRDTAAPILHAVFALSPTETAKPSGSRPDMDGPAPLQLRLRAETIDRGEDPPRLLFPTDKSVVEQPEDGGALTLEMKGGRRPLTWLIDGRRVAVERVARSLEWTPSGPGTVRITVVDVNGRADSATVDVR